MQTFSVEFDDTAQIKLAVNLMNACIQELAKLGPKVTVISVPGNHGENEVDVVATTQLLWIIKTYKLLGL